MRLTESEALDGPLKTVVPSFLHGRVSSSYREETPMQGSLHPALSIAPLSTRSGVVGRFFVGFSFLPFRPCIEKVKCRTSFMEFILGGIGRAGRPLRPGLPHVRPRLWIKHLIHNVYVALWRLVEPKGSHHECMNHTLSNLAPLFTFVLRTPKDLYEPRSFNAALLTLPLNNRSVQQIFVGVRLDALELDSDENNVRLCLMQAG